MIAKSISLVYNGRL